MRFEINHSQDYEALILSITLAIYVIYDLCKKKTTIHSTHRVPFTVFAL